MGRTVLIVDDHASFRLAARSLLEAAGYEVVGEATDGAEALAAVSANAPDCVLLDVQLPDADGFAVAEALSTMTPQPAVILTSSRAAADFGPLVERAPVRGFIPKEALSAAALEKLWA